MRFICSRIQTICLLVPAVLSVTAQASYPQRNGGSRSRVLTGQGAAGDWSTDAPGVRRRISVKDLPKPFQSDSVRNGPKLVPRPEGALPLVPAGFRVEEFASGFKNPRLLRVAPNGDLFVAESRANLIRVIRPTKDGGRAEVNEIFADNLKRPFGIAFYPAGPDPQWIYIGNTDSVVRFPYRNGDLKPRGKIEVIVPDIPGWGELRGGGHWTRDIAFSPNGWKMFVSVGSRSNVFEDPKENEVDRATVLEFSPDGSGRRVFASGIRNAVGIAIHPETGDLWGSVNERDGLGDDLVPDYITRIKEGGFYGWPWYYIGANQDPRHPGVRPELRDKVIVPDVLLQSHYASLQMLFYTGQMFPKEYRHEIFAAEHGSWNRAKRTGYKVIRVPLKKGVPTGEFEDFVTGFVTPQGDVWGRPVGVAVAKDGSLFISDDGSNTIWRVTYSDE